MVQPGVFRALSDGQYDLQGGGEQKLSSTLLKWRSDKTAPIV